MSSDAVRPLTNAFVRTVASLADAKGRRRSGLFVAEGTKCVSDLSEHYGLQTIVALPEWLERYGNLGAVQTLPATGAMLGQLTRLTTAPPVIGLFRRPARYDSVEPVAASSATVLVLDRIQDPGNLGTIIRCCDWMGVRTIVASVETADIYNPKVVQATMGSLGHVRVAYTELVPWLRQLSRNTPVYGTFLDGHNALDVQYAPCGVLVMGNEGQGISPDVERYVTHRVTIPAAVGAAAESLNVATATAMLLALRAKSLKMK